jgi:hypothetical protein
VGKLQGKILLGKSRHRWKDDSKPHLKGIGWDGFTFIHLA